MSCESRVGPYTYTFYNQQQQQRRPYLLQTAVAVLVNDPFSPTFSLSRTVSSRSALRLLSFVHLLSSGLCPLLVRLLSAMLARASLLLRPMARVPSPAAGLAARSVLVVPSRCFSYSNQNKPETKEAANEALTDAKAGKTAAEVKQHKATTGDRPLARESGAAGAKATKDNAVRRGTTPHTAHRQQAAANHADSLSLSLSLSRSLVAPAALCGSALCSVCYSDCGQTSSSKPVNRSDAGPDVLREKGKKSNKTDVSN